MTVALRCSRGKRIRGAMENGNPPANGATPEYEVISTPALLLSSPTSGFLARSRSPKKKTSLVPLHSWPECSKGSLCEWHKIYFRCPPSASDQTLLFSSGRCQRLELCSGEGGPSKRSIRSFSCRGTTRWRGSLADHCSSPLYLWPESLHNPRIRSGAAMAWGNNAQPGEEECCLTTFQSQRAFLLQPLLFLPPSLQDLADRDP